MIDLDAFQLACPPFTGSTWCIKAAAEAGLSGFEGLKAHIHQPHAGGRGSKLRVSTVRHPLEWALSYWLNGGQCNVKQVDAFLPVKNRCISAEDFIRQVVEIMPGHIGRMMLSYNADSFIRTDELNEAFYELLESAGAPKAERAYSFPPQNVTRKAKPRISPTLIDKLMVAENDFCERFHF